MLPKVRSRAGTPTEEDFRSPDGSPLVQDDVSGRWYGYANNQVYPLARINVRAFASVQAAIDSVTSDALLEFPDGDPFEIGAAGWLLDGKTNVHLVGAGAILRLNAAGTLSTLIGGVCSIKFDGCTDCSISGFEMDGNGKASDFVSLNDSVECVIRNNRAYNCGAAGLGGIFSSYGCTRSKVKDNVVSAGLAHGIRMGNYSAAQLETDVAVLNNISRDNTSDGIILSSVGGRCEGNRSLGNGASGIIYGGGAGLSSKRLTITGNTCEGNAFHGIQSDVVYSTSADLPVSVTVSGNVCASNTNAGIYGLYGILTTIIGNVCQDNGTSGILIDEQNTFSVTGNVCKDTRAGGSRTQDNGIEVTAALDDNNIQSGAIVGNVCTNHVSHGIAIATVGASDAIDNLVVTGNTSSDNSGGGIFITEGAAGTITALAVAGNVATGNTSTDLRIDPTDTALGINKYTTVNVAVPVIVPTSTATAASIRLPQGVPPSSPVNGDVWMTAAGLFYRAGGATVGPVA